MTLPSNRTGLMKKKNRRLMAIQPKDAGPLRNKDAG
jgi:hypothetical protein